MSELLLEESVFTVVSVFCVVYLNLPVKLLSWSPIGYLYMYLYISLSPKTYIHMYDVYIYVYIHMHIVTQQHASGTLFNRGAADIRPKDCLGRTLNDAKVDHYHYDSYYYYYVSVLLLMFIVVVILSIISTSISFELLLVSIPKGSKYPIVRYLDLE